MQHIDVDLVGPSAAMAHIIERLRAMEVLVASRDLVRNTDNPDYGWQSITVAVPEPRDTNDADDADGGPG